MYHVNFGSYSGLSHPRETFEDREDARDHVAALLREHRTRASVCVLERGQCWELCEPESAAMIPDWCGVLSLTRKTFECFECGCLHDTYESARECCAEYDCGWCGESDDE